MNTIKSESIRFVDVAKVFIGVNRISYATIHLLVYIVVFEYVKL